MIGPPDQSLLAPEQKIEKSSQTCPHLSRKKTKICLFSAFARSTRGKMAPSTYNAGTERPRRRPGGEFAFCPVHGERGKLVMGAPVLYSGNSTIDSRSVGPADNPVAEETPNPSTQHSSSIRELGRYRSFLRLQAIGMVSGFHSRLEHSDIVQQTLLDAHQNLDQFRGSNGAEMSKWLSQILANNIADAARALTRKKRDVRREQSLQRTKEDSRNGTLQWLAADQSTPSLCVTRHEQLQRLNEAIGQLPFPQQQAIVFHHLQGRSLNETARMIGRSPAAVAGLLFRGLKSLRSLLAG
jgi:RNA polymerase sigma-70 factor (ECF subfamily)